MLSNSHEFGVWGKSPSEDTMHHDTHDTMHDTRHVPPKSPRKLPRMIPRKSNSCLKNVSRQRSEGTTRLAHGEIEPLRALSAQSSAKIRLRQPF